MAKKTTKKTVKKTTKPRAGSKPKKAPNSKSGDKKSVKDKLAGLKIPPVTDSGKYDTKIVTEENIELCAEMILRRLYKHQIKKIFTEQIVGRKPAVHTFEVLMRKAREFIREKYQESLDNAKADAIGFYEYVIRDERGEFEGRDKVKAQERIDSIFGNDHKFGGSNETAEEMAEAILEATRSMSRTVPKPKEEADD